MFANVQVMKTAITDLEPDDFFDQHVVGGQSAHLSAERLKFLCDTFSRAFDVVIPEADVVLVGSGKLGFALHEKRAQTFTLPAFRPYGVQSDLDISICNAELFRKIWHELSAHACFQPAMPWNYGKLADYLMYGWLRPDQFPKGQALVYCDRFYETVGEIRRDKNRGAPRASVALYYSLDHLRNYQTRSVRLCRQKLEVMK
jgi:hypothetical protein